MAPFLERRGWDWLPLFKSALFRLPSRLRRLYSGSNGFPKKPKSCSLTSPAFTSEIWTCTYLGLQFSLVSIFSLLLNPRRRQVKCINATLYHGPHPMWIKQTESSDGADLCAVQYIYCTLNLPPGVVPSPSCHLNLCFRPHRPSVYTLTGAAGVGPVLSHAFLYRFPAYLLLLYPPPSPHPPQQYRQQILNKDEVVVSDYLL